MNHSTQTHDFNPGFGAPVGAHGSTFWTAAIPDRDVQFHFGADRTEMRVTNLAVEDYFTFPNGLADGHEVDATVSFDVVWSGPVTRRVEVEHGTNGNRFAGEFVEDHATVTWSGSNELGFRFRAKPGNFSTSVPGRAFAELGHERNGVFAGEDDNDGSFAAALGARGPQGEASAADQFFAALALDRTNLAARPGPTPAAPDPENGSALSPTKRATIVWAAQRHAVDPAAMAPDLFAEVEHPGDGVP